VVFIDSLAYGKLAVVPWNIVQYNIFGGEDHGPELYGTEPWYFYIQNLLLNFNVLAPLALLSLPALKITHTWDYRRLGFTKHQPDETSPYTLVALRLAPFYLWVIVLTLQPHKEERFMYPAYSLLCFNAATTLYLVRGWLEAIYTKVVSVYAVRQFLSPQMSEDSSTLQASQTKLFRLFTLFVITLSIALSGARILALFHYYHAPLGVSYYIEHKEVPRLLNATGLLPPPQPQRAGYNPAYADDEYIDISALKQIGVRVCYGKEWYRFPSHYLFPEGIEVQFVKSGFSGLLPRHFATEPIPSEGLWKRGQTRVAPPGLNDMNREEPSVYVCPCSRFAATFAERLIFRCHVTRSTLARVII
jgi:alpha-1,2-mannosyltransferase